jgi:hypothetical protein
MDLGLEGDFTVHEISIKNKKWISEHQLNNHAKLKKI